MLGGLEAGLSELPDGAADERAERALRRRTRAALHAPTVRAREAARAGDAMTYAAALDGAGVDPGADRGGRRALTGRPCGCVVAAVKQSVPGLDGGEGQARHASREGHITLA